MEIGAQGGVQEWGHQPCTVSELKWGYCWQGESEAAAPRSTAPALLPSPGMVRQQPQAGAAP